MNLDQLYYFRKLAELQHFTNAATELFISQPSLSYSITKLEKELGTSLFQKKGRNIVLTNQGKDFYMCVNEILTKLDDGVNKLKKNTDISTGKIDIGTIPILCGDFMPKNIRTYMDSFPKTTFDIFTCITSNEVIAGVKDGIYDIGFCYKVETENDLIFVPMLSHELVVITKKGHELSKKGVLSPSDLHNYPIITYRENTPLGISIRNLFKEQKISPNIIFSFDEELTISEMVGQDFGIGLLSNVPILENHNLSILPLNAKSDYSILYLTYHKDTNQSKSIKNFILHLKSSTLITCSLLFIKKIIILTLGINPLL